MSVLPLVVAELPLKTSSVVPLHPVQRNAKLLFIQLRRVLASFPGARGKGVPGLHCTRVHTHWLSLCTDILPARSQTIRRRLG